MAFTWHLLANGEVEVLGFPFVIRIKRALAAHEIQWSNMQPILEAWEPTPQRCWSCAREAMFHIDTRRAGPELTILTYRCGACGVVESEPLD